MSARASTSRRRPRLTTLQKFLAQKLRWRSKRKMKDGSSALARERSIDRYRQESRPSIRLFPALPRAALLLNLPAQFEPAQAIHRYARSNQRSNRRSRGHSDGTLLPTCRRSAAPRWPSVSSGQTCKLCFIKIRAAGAVAAPFLRRTSLRRRAGGGARLEGAPCTSQTAPVVLAAPP